MSLAVLVRGRADHGKFRAHRWIDRTSDIRSLSWSRSAGQVATASVGFTPRSLPRCVHPTGAQEYFGRATAVRSNGAVDLLLSDGIGGRYVCAGDRLVLDAATWSPAASSPTDVELEVVGLDDAGGQRYSIFDSPTSRDSDIGVLFRVATTSDGDDLYEEGQGITPIDLDPRSGSDAIVREIDVRHSGIRSEMAIVTHSFIGPSVLAHYMMAVRHNDSGRVWYARFSEQGEWAPADRSALTYRLPLHGDGSIVPLVRAGDDWTLLVVRDDADGLVLGTAADTALEFRWGSETSLWTAGVLPAAPTASYYAGLLWRVLSRRSTKVQSTGVITFFDESSPPALGVGDAHLRRVRQVGDTLRVELTESDGTTAAAVESGRYVLAIRHTATPAHIWRATLTGASTTANLDGNDAAILRSNQSSSDRFDLLLLDSEHYGLDVSALELGSDPGEYRWASCLPDFTPRSTTVRYSRTGGSSTPQIGYAPVCEIDPWEVEDGAETRVVLTTGASIAGLARAGASGRVRVSFVSAPNPRIAVGDEVYLLGATPTDGSDPLDTLFEVVAVDGAGLWIDVTAALDLPAGTGDPADVLGYGGDLLRYSGDTLAYGVATGAAAEVVHVWREGQREPVWGGWLINPTSERLPGGRLEAVGASGVDYSAALDRRLNRGAAYQSVTTENAGHYVRSLVYDKWEAAHAEGWLDGIEDDAGAPFDPPFDDATAGGETATLRTILDAVAERAGGSTHWHVDARKTLRWQSAIEHSGLVLGPSAALSARITEQRDRARNIVDVSDSDATAVTVTDTADILRRQAVEGGSGRYEVRETAREGANIGDQRARQWGLDRLARYPFIRRLDVETLEQVRLTSAEQAILLGLQPPALMDWVVDRPAAPAVTVVQVGSALYVEPTKSTERLPHLFAAGRRLRFTGVTGVDVLDISGDGGPRGAVWCDLPSGVTATIGSDVSVDLVEPWLIDQVSVEVLPGAAGLRRWRISAMQTRLTASTARVQDGWVGQLRAAWR